MQHIDGIGAPRGPIPTLVNMSGRDDSHRAETERFIHHCFARVYGADVREFMPVLMRLHDGGGTLLGALGLRSARDEALFLERYLERPVEQALAAGFNTPVDRDAVTEVGNLAVAAPGGGRWLITALTAYLFAAGGTWVVFTIGPVLHNAFRRMGLELVDLGPADPDRLCASERAGWGRYYEQKPRVMAGRVEHGYRVLQQICDAETSLSSLWRHAGQAGGGAAWACC